MGKGIILYFNCLYFYSAESSLKECTFLATLSNSFETFFSQDFSCMEYNLCIFQRGPG